MPSSRWLEIGSMDELGRLDSPAHRLDPRAKALVTAAFIVVVMSFGRYEVAALAPFFLYPLWLIGAGRIPLFFLLRKLAIAAPFALAVGLFNPWLDRAPVAELGPWVLTGGWLSFASILIRFLLTVGAALALVACTGMHRLGAALEGLGFPRLFVTQLLLLYRYLFVIADEGQRLVRGVSLRAPAGGALPLKVYGSLVGHLLLRSMDRAERVYRAMLARGYRGEIRTLDRARFRRSDGAFVAGWLLYFAAARCWNGPAWLGHWLAGVCA